MRRQLPVYTRNISSTTNKAVYDVFTSHIAVAWNVTGVGAHGRQAFGIRTYALLPRIRDPAESYRWKRLPYSIHKICRITVSGNLELKVCIYAKEGSRFNDVRGSDTESGPLSNRTISATGFSCILSCKLTSSCLCCDCSTNSVAIRVDIALAGR